MGHAYTFAFWMTAPASPGYYPIDWKMQEGSVDRFGQGIKKVITVTDQASLPEYDAKVVSSTFPDTILAGQNVNVEMVFMNTGKKEWKMSDQVFLGAVDNQDDLASSYYWRVGYGTRIIPHGSTYAFKIKINQSVLGTYNTDWQMIKEGAFWFGEKLVKEVQVIDSTAASNWSLYK